MKLKVIIELEVDDEEYSIEGFSDDIEQATIKFSEITHGDIKKVTVKEKWKMKISRLFAGSMAGIIMGLVFRMTMDMNLFLQVLIDITVGVGLLFIADFISVPEYKGNKLNGEDVNLNGVSVECKEEDDKTVITVGCIPKTDSVKLISFLRSISAIKVNEEK